MRMARLNHGAMALLAAAIVALIAGGSLAAATAARTINFPEMKAGSTRTAQFKCVGSEQRDVARILAFE